MHAQDDLNPHILHMFDGIFRLKRSKFLFKLFYVPFDFASSDLQSTLVISNSKGLYETLRDIRTSTYQICGNEENN